MKYLTRLALLLLTLPTVASTTASTVSSIADLNAKIGLAVAGDIIIKNGIYTNNSSIAINRVGTAANPIIIRAETIGGVEIAGSNGFNLNSPATYVTIQGFKLTHAASVNLGTSVHHIRLTRNVIQLTIPSSYDVPYFNISGNDMEIDRNEMRNKTTLGKMLDISGTGGQVAGGFGCITIIFTISPVPAATARKPFAGA